MFLNRPALMREVDDRLERRGLWQVHEVVLCARRRAQVALGEQPHLRRERALTPRVCRRDTDRRKAGAPRPRPGRVLPRYDAPLPPRRDFSRDAVRRDARRERGPRVRPALAPPRLDKGTATLRELVPATPAPHFTAEGRARDDEPKQRRDP